MTKLAVIVAVVAVALMVALKSEGGTEQNASKLVDEFKCIHHYEGAWNSVGYVHGVAKYFGGFQMDRVFELSYGREFVRVFGHANRWPPALQLATAIRAWTTRGFHPWPTSGRTCGLLP